MAKKVKCIECMECMNWALPYKVNEQNIEYAKQCLVIAKRSIVCGYTMKTKKRDNEQYCKHFTKTLHSNDFTRQIEELEAKIKEYETRCNNGEM